MDDENNITLCIESIKLKEQHEEQQRKEKRKYEDTISKLEKNIKSCSTRHDELLLEHSELILAYDGEKCTQAELNLKYSVLKAVLEEQGRLLQIETANLEEIRERVWQNREKFCDSVKQHIDNYGVAAMINCNFQKIAAPSNAAPDKNTLDQDTIIYGADVTQTVINENKYLQQEINSRNEIVANLDIQMSELIAAKNNLEKEFEEGPESIRLRSALNYSKEDTDRMLKEIEHLNKTQNPVYSRNNENMDFQEQETNANIENKFHGNTGTDLTNQAIHSNCYDIKSGGMADRVNQNQERGVSQSASCHFQLSSSLYQDAREINVKRKSTNKRGKFTYKSYKDKH